jgi:hypothetical protein
MHADLLLHLRCTIAERRPTGMALALAALGMGMSHAGG